MPKGDVRIRWIKSEATRTKGHVETWPQDELLATWLDKGWVEVVTGKDAEETQAPEGGETKDVERPPVDRSMKGKGSKKKG